MKILKGLVATVFLLIAILSTLYVVRDMETLVLDEQSRAELPGQFIKLDQGVTHYNLIGSVDDPTVVLVHGFSAASFIWERMDKELVESGFRVLHYDLYGRGLSDRPDTNYGMDLYVEQLKGLLDGVGIDKPVHIVGLAMGGAVVAHFTNRYPELVDKLVFIDPLVISPHKPEAEPLKKPYVGDYLAKVVLVPKIVEGLPELVTNPDLYPNWGAKFNEQVYYKGYAAAALSSVRNLLDKDFTKQYEALGNLGKSVQLFWGREDQKVPFAHSEVIVSVIPNVEFHPVENAGHIPHYEYPAEVNGKLIRFLAATPNEEVVDSDEAILGNL